MTCDNLYAEELRAAAARAGDAEARARLLRIVEHLQRDEELDVEELMLLSVAAMAVQTPEEVDSWGRSVARRHAALGPAIQSLLESAGNRWRGKPANSCGLSSFSKEEKPQ